MLYLMSTSILPNTGRYDYWNISLPEAKKLINTNEFISAIGHDSTAEIMTELLNKKIEKNRLTVSMQTGDMALVFKLKSRPPEGAILDRPTLEKIGYSFGVIKRIA